MSNVPQQAPPPASVYSMPEAAAILALAADWRGARFGQSGHEWRAHRDRVIVDVALEYRLETRHLAEAFSLSDTKIRDILSSNGLVAVTSYSRNGQSPAVWVKRQDVAGEKLRLTATRDAPTRSASADTIALPNDRSEWPQVNDRFLKRLIPAAIRAGAIPPHSVRRVAAEAKRLRLPVEIDATTQGEARA